MRLLRSRPASSDHVALAGEERHTTITCVRRSTAAGVVELSTRSPPVGSRGTATAVDAETVLTATRSLRRKLDLERLVEPGVLEG